MKLLKNMATLVTALAVGAAVGLFAACTEETVGPEPGPVDQTPTYTVTFDLNYGGAANDSQSVKEGEKAAKPETPQRSGYAFDDWYVDTDLSAVYDFDTPVTANITVYANWLDDSVTYRTLTLDLNYEGSVNSTRKVPDNERLQTIADPVREGYAFFGWYNEADCTTKFSYSAQKITEDTTLYARWGKLTTFEAEETFLEDLLGPSSSGNAGYLSMILKDQDNLGASGKYFISYLYAKDGDNGGEFKTTLTFKINSSKAVSDAKLYLRLSAELASITLNGSEYVVEVNGKTYNYDDIDLTLRANETPRLFEDYLISGSVELVEGENTVRLIVKNSETPLGGTTTAKAPTVDCIKIATDAELTWAEGYPIDNVSLIP